MRTSNLSFGEKYFALTESEIEHKSAPNISGKVCRFDILAKLYNLQAKKLRLFSFWVEPGPDEQNSVCQRRAWAR